MSLWSVMEKRKRMAEDNQKEEMELRKFWERFPETAARSRKIGDCEVALERRVERFRRLMTTRYANPVKRLKTLRIFAHHLIHNQPEANGNTPRKVSARKTRPGPAIPPHYSQGFNPMQLMASPGQYPGANPMESHYMDQMMHAQNEHANQYDHGSLKEIPEQNRPGWTLVLEGCFPGDQDLSEPKLSSFFEEIVINLDPNLYAAPSRITWKPPDVHSMQTSKTFDGLRVTMDGHRPTKMAIAFKRKMTTANNIRYKPSKVLSRIHRIPRDDGEPKSFYISALYEYIKKHNLQKNIDEKRMVFCDNALRELFNCDSFYFSSVGDRLMPHLNPPDPVILEYQIDMDIDSKKKDTFIDIEIEIEDDFQKKALGFLEKSSRLNEERNILLNTLEDQMDYMKTVLQTKGRQIDFLERFSQDPLKVIKEMTPVINQDSKDVIGKVRELFHDEVPAWMEEATKYYLEIQNMAKKKAKIEREKAEAKYLHAKREQEGQDSFTHPHQKLKGENMDDAQKTHSGAIPQGNDFINSGQR